MTVFPLFFYVKRVVVGKLGGEGLDQTIALSVACGDGGGEGLDQIIALSVACGGRGG